MSIVYSFSCYRFSHEFIRSNIILLWTSLFMAMTSTILEVTLLVEAKCPKSMEKADKKYYQKYDGSVL